VALETPLLEVLGQPFDVIRGAFVKRFPNFKPPTFEASTTDVLAPPPATALAPKFAPKLPPATKEVTKEATETSTAASVTTEPSAAGEIAASISPMGSPLANRPKNAFEA